MLGPTRTLILLFFVYRPIGADGAGPPSFSPGVFGGATSATVSLNGIAPNPLTVDTIVSVNSFDVSKYGVRALLFVVHFAS